jgi:hypothetical protein
MVTKTFRIFFYFYFFHATNEMDQNGPRRAQYVGYQISNGIKKTNKSSEHFISQL